MLIHYKKDVSWEKNAVSHFFLVDKVHYRSQPFGTDNPGLVYDTVSVARIGYVAGSLNPYACSFAHKNHQSTEEVCDSTVVVPCPQWATQMPGKASKER